MNNFLSTRQLSFAIQKISDSIAVAEKRKKELNKFLDFRFVSVGDDDEYCDSLRTLYDPVTQENEVSSEDLHCIKSVEKRLYFYLKLMIKHFDDLKRIEIDIEQMKLLKKHLTSSRVLLWRSFGDLRQLIRNLKNNFRTFDDEENENFDLVKNNLLANQNLNIYVYKIYKKCA